MASARGVGVFLDHGADFDDGGLELAFDGIDADRHRFLEPVDEVGQDLLGAQRASADIADDATAERFERCGQSAVSRSSRPAITAVPAGGHRCGHPTGLVLDGGADHVGAPVDLGDQGFHARIDRSREVGDAAVDDLDQFAGAGAEQTVEPFELVVERGVMSALRFSIWSTRSPERSSSRDWNGLVAPSIWLRAAEPCSVMVALRAAPICSRSPIMAVWAPPMAARTRSELSITASRCSASTWMSDAQACLVFGIGPLERGHLVVDHDFEFAGPGEGAFEPVAEGVDLAAHGLADGRDLVGSRGFRIGQAHGGLGHRRGGDAQFLGAAHQDGDGEESR